MKPLTHQIPILEELKLNNKALVYLPSGAGKTHVSAYYVLNKEPKTMIYAVHRLEILEQTYNIFKLVCPFMNDSNMGFVAESKKDYQKPYLFCSVQTITLKKNLEKMQRDIDCLIIDEFHHAAAKSYQNILEYFETQNLLGLTATPDRHDKQNVLNLVDNNIVGNIDIFTGIEQKILVPFHYIGLWDNIDYKNIRWNGYKYYEFDLDKYLLIAKRDKAVIKEYLARIAPENRLTIGFCNSVKHVNRMVAKFKRAGIMAAGISYLDDPLTRRNTIQNFRDGYYKVLFTRDILNEGVDFPECSAIMLLRPTYSKTIFLQQLGRGLRTREGKKDVLVLDFMGNYRNVQKIKDYLVEITKKPISRLTKERAKPVYNMNVPFVEFDSRVLDFIEVAEGHNNKYVSPETVLEYFKTKLPDDPPFPYIDEIDHKNGYKYSNGTIQNKFGGYVNMLIKLGKADGIMKSHPFYSRRHFVEYYKKLKEYNNGVIPTIKDVERFEKAKKLSMRRGSIISAFGTFNKFIEEMGDTPRFKTRNYPRGKFLGKWTKSLMAKLYREKKKEIGPDKIPTLKQLDDSYVGFDKAIWRLFNNDYNNFLIFVEKRDGLTKKCSVCGKKYKIMFKNNNFRKSTVCSKTCVTRRLRERRKQNEKNSK